MEVEKRFNQFRDPDDSLFLAKMYYEKNDYKKAEEWALKTNKINNNIEESWIIFAKSKVKSGKIDEAIHILKNYIRQSNSQKAKILLLKIKK
jgi:tetratricopeptide (TPR) repeat protein